jgi:hypothetical protein
LILETIAMVLLGVALILFVVAIAILFPFLQREARADAEAIRAARLRSTTIDHDTD